QPRGAVIAAGGQGGAVGAERHRAHKVGVAGEGGDVAALAGSPQMDRVVGACGSEGVSVRAERQVMDGSGLAGEGGRRTNATQSGDRAGYAAASVVGRSDAPGGDRKKSCHSGVAAVQLALGGELARHRDTLLASGGITLLVREGACDGGQKE